MPCSRLISGSPAETSSNSGSESNNARNPTKRNGSLSTTAIRMTGFLATAAFIVFPVGLDSSIQHSNNSPRMQREGDRREITGVTWNWASKPPEARRHRETPFS